MEDERIVGGIPFPDDLLFHFFNKDTIVTDEYIQDPVSGLKMYPKKSSSVKATAANSCIPVSKTILTNTRKIRSLLKHKLSDLNNGGYVWAGENVSSPYATTGLHLTSGKYAYSFYWKGSTSGACAINAGQLEDDNFYLCTQTIGAENISMKMNKLTIVNNAIVIGNDINSTTTAKGTEELTGDRFGILSACYSNGSYNYASGNQMVYIEFLDANDNVLLSFNFSEGAGQQVFDIISGNAYQIYNITESAFWNYTQDFNHHNFRYGFTLYQKAGEADIRVPNKKDGSEITPVSIPSGYSRIANYKECRLTFNQCENVFVLDNVSAGIKTLHGTFNQTFWGGVMPLNVDFLQSGVTNGKPKWVSVDGDLVQWEDNGGLAWCVRSHLYLPGIQCYSYDDVESPDLCVTWTGRGGTNYIDFELTIGNASVLYAADVDFVLFTENTGVAKEINVGTLDVNLGIDRGYLYINPNPQEKNFMLYKTNKTLNNDVKVIKYIGLKDEIVTDENGDVVYDKNDHAILE